MNFNITIVAVEPKTATAKNGKPYKLVELAYKNNSFQGKIEAAKINQYSAVFNSVSNMLPGQVYDVVKEKDASGFYQWLSVSQAVPGAVPTQPQAAVQSVAGAKADYATQDAKKQVFIIKQSSLKNAIDLLSIGAKVPPSTQTILDQAQLLTDWVLADKPLSMDDMTNLPNDIDMQVE